MDKQQLVVIAMGAAHRAHKEFGVNPATRVDVFSVLRTVGACVFFRPLHSIYGAYLPTGDSIPGLLINSNLPLSVQRFTAAHELGHLYLGHKIVSLERGADFVPEERSGADPDEFVAEAFGAFFLMPKPLVKGSMAELGIREGRIESSEVYLLALRMGTSYAATVNQLLTLKLVHFAQAKELRKHAPKEIKEKLNDEKAVGRHDVWLLNENWNGKEIYPAVLDTIRIQLKETPTSGYTWLLQDRPEGVEVREDTRKGEDSGIGGTQVHEFVASVAEDASDSRLVLQKKRPWDQESVKAEFSVEIRPQELRKTGPLVLPKIA
jgi:Zn-dependent peptidase ImmA (M78 family)